MEMGKKSEILTEIKLETMVSEWAYTIGLISKHWVQENDPTTSYLVVNRVN